MGTRGTQLYRGPGQAARMWEVTQRHFGVNPAELSDGGVVFRDPMFLIQSPSVKRKELRQGWRRESSFGPREQRE